MEELFKHWDLVVSIGLIFASHAKMQANQKNSDRRVAKLEQKQDGMADKLSDLKVDMGELKGMTKMILDQIKGR